MRSKLPHRSFWLSLLIVASFALTAGLMAQSAGGPTEYGPFFCDPFCNLGKLDPGSGQTLAEKNTMILINAKSVEFNIQKGDTIILCNGINCAVYKKSGSDDYMRQKIEKETSSPVGSPEPPGSGPVGGPGGSHPGGGIPIAYWPTSTSKCIRATVSYGSTTSVAVYCG